MNETKNEREQLAIMAQALSLGSVALGSIQGIEEAMERLESGLITERKALEEVKAHLRRFAILRDFLKEGELKKKENEDRILS